MFNSGNCSEKIFSKVFVYYNKVFYLISMLTPQLKKNIDQKWDNCWPVSSLRPLAVLDLIAYFFFIKKLDDRGLITKKLTVASADQFIYTREIEEFSWGKLKEIDAQTIHDFFTKKSGLLELMKLYGTSDSLYSKYFKVPSLVPPTPKLLMNVIEMINSIESSDGETKAELVEYLFRKTEVINQNGPEIISEIVSRLMVSVAEPKYSDSIWDPSAGNASLLISAANYIKNIAPIHSLNSEKLKGMESSIVQLRLAAMRMILHGIKEPNLDLFLWEQIKLNEKPSLILSNLLFTNIENAIPIESESMIPANIEKEIFLLDQILQNLQSGARAVILVPEIVLKSKSPEMIKVRQNIVDDYHLEGVINLPQISNSLFSGAAILIFNQSVATEKVWFSKMEKSKKTRTVNETYKNDKIDWLVSYQSNEINPVLYKWKNRTTSGDNKSESSFYITVYDIKENHYSLNFNDYKIISAEAENETKNHTDNNPVIATRKENLHQFYQRSTPLIEKKRKRKMLPAAIVLVILLTAAFFYFYNLKGNNLVKALTDGLISEHKSPDSVAKRKRADSSLQKVNSIKKATITANNDSIADSNIADSASDSTVVKNAQTKPSDSLASRGYTVITKTWFYRTPDTTKQKKLFLEPRTDLILNPTDEQNGFVYVVYVNKKGESTRGWLNKKDLEPVQ